MHKTIFDAEKSELKLNLKELFQYKDLFLVLAYRDLRVRYSQTFLGLFWAFLQPFATLLIFVVVFGKAVNVDTEGIPYPLFAITGMAAWTYFAFVLNQSGNSIISSQEMVKKIYFPRLVIPLSKAMVGFVDFGIAIIFIAILLCYYRQIPSLNIVMLPLFVVLAVISALGIGIWLSALTIRYRDFQHVVPFLVQFGLYATPVGYPTKLIVENFSDWVLFLYYLNPMAGVVEGFRWSILGGSPPSQFAYFSFINGFIMFFFSLFYFKKVEKIMADIV